MDKIARILNDNESFLLIPHDRADGDAAGSMLALAEGLRLAGKQAHTLLLGPVGERYEFMFEKTKTPVLGRDITLETIPVTDVVIVVDTSAMRQLEPVSSWLANCRGKVIAIDHHERGDLNCVESFIDEHSPATGLMVAALLEHLGWLDGPSMAENLLIAVATDTGWFSYNNVTTECFEWAGRFAKMGARLYDIHQKLFLSESPERFRLMAETLCSVELLADNRVVVFTLKQADFARAGATQAQTENLIDQASRLKTMKVGVLFVEAADGTVRISLRSRSPFNVHEFAQQFGGGGHRQAAGIKIEGQFDEVKSRVLTAMVKMLSEVLGNDD